MSKQFDEAYKAVKILVEEFKKNHSRFVRADYKEHEVRVDFIDRFFEALGWDVSHKKQRDPFRQEVRPEKSEREGRVDYSFFLSPDFRNPVFFVEAKKPSVDLYQELYYLQTIKYSWNASLPVTILTNFQQLHILDCRVKVKAGDGSVFSGDHKKYSFTDYLDKEKFAEIYYTFSREAVELGNIEKYVEKLYTPKGKAIQTGLFKGGYRSVDEDFLDYINDLREELAKALKRKNESLDSEQLTEATQRIIDRLVFIRFLEDKGILDKYFVSEFGNAGSAWKEFINTCLQLNTEYNGAVFKKHFIDKDFVGPDDKMFHSICRDICHLNSPYNFNYIPVHILGSIYEQFLGKVVHATAKRVSIDPKPEVRKAGGVYYTPKYIVEFIVDHTIGNLIKDKTVDEIAKLRFADIACGSGSFLISVYDHLLFFHTVYYNKAENHVQAQKDGCRKDEDGLWQLSIKQKQEILINNVFGVDIDAQAVEVAQLSLYLKLLENENVVTVAKHLAQKGRLFGAGKILPDLSQNIKCGNSLIGTQFGTALITADFDEKVNAFNFHYAFKDIFKQNGGFDAIVGNPPWGAEIHERNFLKTNFETTSTDSAAYFIEQAIRLSKGTVGYIVPITIAYYSGWSSIREYTFKNSSIDIILNAGIAFPEVNLESLVLILSKKHKDKDPHIFEAQPIKRPIIPKQINSLGHYDSKITKIANIIPFIALSKLEVNLLHRLHTNSIKIKDVAESIFRGLYIPDSEKATLKEGNIEFINKVPDVKRYLIEKTMLIDISKNKQWSAKAKTVMQKRIFFKVLRGNRLCAFPDVEGKYLTTEKLVNLVINQKIYPVSYAALAGLINSSLLSFYIQRILFSKTTETSRVLDSVYMNHLILPKLTAKNNDLFKQLEKEVSSIISCKVRLQNVLTDKDLNFLENKIIGSEQNIDNITYSLFGLSKQEIEFVEKSEVVKSH
jgi:adenine-specific DNA-methyltransferase